MISKLSALTSTLFSILFIGNVIGLAIGHLSNVSDRSLTVTDAMLLKSFL